MKILFVSNSYYPYQGGVVQSIDATMKALQKQGHEVYLITFDFQVQGEDSFFVFKIPTWITFTYKSNTFVCPKFPHKKLQEVIALIKPDIIHAHHPFYLGPKALRIAHQLNIPIVFTYHTQYEEYAHYIPFFSQMTKWLIKKRVYDFCHHVNGIIFPSHSIKTKYAQDISPRCSLVLPSPIHDDFFIRNYTKKKLSFPIKLLYVGRIVSEKNINFLIDVIKQLNDNYQLYIVGYGSELQKMKNYAYNNLKLSHQKAYFVEQPTREQLHQEYRHADIFIFASKTETQGLVLAEAMAYALPVIALKAPGPIDIIRHGENGYLVQNVYEMVQTMQIINKSLYEKLSLNAYKTAQNYKADQICQQLVAWYKYFKYD